MDMLKSAKQKSTVLLLIVGQLFLFIGFGFTNSIIFNVACGGGALLLVILATYKDYKKENTLRLVLFLFPLLIYGILISIGRFSQYEFPIYVKILIPFSFLIFLLIGYFFSFNKTINFDFLLKFILLGVAIISLVNLIATLVNLGPWYAFRNGSNYLYKNGICSHYTINRSAYALVGFEIDAVSIEYYMMFPFILLSFGALLFFKSPRHETKEFVSYCLLCLIGVLSLALVFSKYMLVPLVIVLILLASIISFFKFKKMQCKTTLIVLIILAFIGLLLFIFVLINAQAGSFAYNFTHSNSFLNKLFNQNAYMDSINKILSNVFSRDKLFGFSFNHDVFYNTYNTLSGDLVIDQFVYTGIFSFIFFIILIGFGIYSIYKVLKKTDYIHRKKYLLPIAYLTIFLGCTMFTNVAFISQFGAMTYPIFFNVIFLGALMIFGFFIKESEAS